MKRPRRRHLWVLAVGWLLLGVAACAERLQEVPESLIGIWETEEEGWSGRFLEIRADEVRFGSGSRPADTYEILGSTSEPLGSRVGYTIRYQDVEFDEAGLHLIYDPATGSMTLENRPQVVWWLRGAERPPTPEKPPRARSIGRVG